MTVTDQAQTPYQDLYPSLPEGFNSPFWYAAVQSFWLYYRAELAELERTAEALDAGDELQIAQFQFPDGSLGGLVSLDFQRYTGHGPAYLEAVHEVEFNMYVYPHSRLPDVPLLTVAQFLNGEDQGRTIGGLRLHVPCDSTNAIRAGRGLFGEPKYLAAFDYQAPTPNDPTVTTWSYSVSQPPKSDGTSGRLMWTTTADLTSVAPTSGAPAPLTEYGILKDAGEPRLIGNSWNFYGPFQTYDLSADGGELVTLELGTADDDTGTIADLARLIGDSPAIAAQVYASPPVSVESRGWFTVPAASA